MNQPPFGFGIAGTGMIAGVIADALEKSAEARLAAVSSRRMEKAREFVQSRRGAAAVEGVDQLLAREDVEAVYIATPTVAKEAIAMAAIEAGKHILIDKPFTDAASVERMTTAAADRNLVFMDATHFVHHPRTAAIKQDGARAIGLPRSLHTSFYFPLADRNNIRFNPDQEPMTALGDMGWYSLRAVVEYLRPLGKIVRAVTAPTFDPETHGIVRTSGLIAFESGEVSTFDVGYTAGTVLMDWQLLGTHGVLSMDDFVLDWANSWAFGDPKLTAGYYHRSGDSSRGGITFIPVPSTTPQEVAMVENFARLARSGNPEERNAFASATLKTQQYLDALWQTVNFGRPVNPVPHP